LAGGLLIMDNLQRSFLFEAVEDAKGRTILSEIESVAKKAKSMSVFEITRGMLDDEFYAGLIKKSIDMGLVVAAHKGFSQKAEGDSQEVLLFFLPGEEVWRIPAYISMKKAFSDDPWSDGLETLHSSLLGYSESQIRSWIDDHNRRLAWANMLLSGQPYAVECHQQVGKSLHRSIVHRRGYRSILQY